MEPYKVVRLTLLTCDLEEMTLNSVSLPIARRKFFPTLQIVMRIKVNSLG